MKKKALIEELRKLEGRSMFEMLPAFRFKEGKNYTHIDLIRAYYKGCKETEEAWHNAIKELKEKVKGDEK